MSDSESEREVEEVEEEEEEQEEQEEQEEEGEGDESEQKEAGESPAKLVKQSKAFKDLERWAKSMKKQDFSKLISLVPVVEQLMTQMEKNRQAHEAAMKKQAKAHKKAMTDLQAKLNKQLEVEAEKLRKAQEAAAKQNQKTLEAYKTAAGEECKRQNELIEAQSQLIGIINSTLPTKQDRSELLQHLASKVDKDEVAREVAELNTKVEAVETTAKDNLDALEAKVNRGVEEAKVVTDEMQTNIAPLLPRIEATEARVEETVPLVQANAEEVTRLRRTLEGDNVQAVGGGKNQHIYIHAPGMEVEHALFKEGTDEEIKQRKSMIQTNKEKLDQLEARLGGVDEKIVEVMEEFKAQQVRHSELQHAIELTKSANKSELLESKVVVERLCAETTSAVTKQLGSFESSLKQSQQESIQTLEKLGEEGRAAINLRVSVIQGEIVEVGKKIAELKKTKASRQGVTQMATIMDALTVDVKKMKSDILPLCSREYCEEYCDEAVSLGDEAIKGLVTDMAVVREQINNLGKQLCKVGAGHKVGGSKSGSSHHKSAARESRASSYSQKRPERFDKPVSRSQGRPRDVAPDLTLGGAKATLSGTLGRSPRHSSRKADRRHGSSAQLEKRSTENKERRARLQAREEAERNAVTAPAEVQAVEAPQQAMEAPQQAEATPQPAEGGRWSM